MKHTLLRGMGILVIGAAACASVAAQQAKAVETDQVDAEARGEAFPHYWEKMFGSGRAVLAMRESYRDDLREVKAATDFEYVRFHGIFLDELGVYDEDATGKPVYNFSYVDQIYDGLLKNGVRPYVELSFMPKKLAAEQIKQAFWYQPVVAPPKDYAKWDDLIRKFAEHLVARNGENAEISKPADSSRRTGDGASGLGGQVHRARDREQCACRFRVDARVWKRPIGRYFRDARRDSTNADGLQGGTESSRPDQSIGEAEHAADLE
jgi:hypothetical protein